MGYTHIDEAAMRPASPHDSARCSPEPSDEFHTLVDDIRTILGPSSGIDSADVDVEELKRVLSEYKSNEYDWSKYAFADHSRAYTRNLVDAGNGKCNLLVLVWSPGKASPIHDHANAHCVMKILKGTLTETIYNWPCEASSSPCATAEHACSTHQPSADSASLEVKRSTNYTTDGVTYMSDQLGLHRVQNSHPNELAVSLHLYTPPNAAKHGCHIFDERTGKSSHVQQCHFYSEFGVKMES